MSFTLYTQTPAFAPELFDMLRLFLGAGEYRLSEIPQADAVHTLMDDGSLYRCRCVFRGQNAERSLEKQAGSPLEVKRAVKRLCRQTLYDVLKAATALHPPWGSLTGIRPTRLFYEQLALGASAEEAERALCGLFDLHTHKAQLLGRIVAAQSELLPPSPQHADVYIGIPFCRGRCSYCSFPGGDIGNGALVAPYLNALENEMQKTRRLMDAAGLKLRALYIGGGTPTSPDDAAFDRLMDMTGRFFPNPVEWTVEAGRPDTLNDHKLNAMRAAGAKRISINPQTFHDATLQRIGRRHTAAQVVTAYESALRHGLDHINMDLIAGLPGETAEDFERSVACALSLRPASLTVHTLAIKRGAALHEAGHIQTDDASVAAMTAHARAAADAQGMQPYYLYRQKYMAGNQENTGYAFPGHSCLYNVDMMEETTNIFGIGSGAMSKRILGKESRILRAPNVLNIEAYIRRVDEMVTRKKRLFLGD